MSGAWLADRFDGLDNDPATRKLIAAAVAAEAGCSIWSIAAFHQFSFLHHEPRRSRVRGLPSAGLRPGGGASSVMRS